MVSIDHSEGSVLFCRSYSVFDGLYGAIVVDDVKKLESMLGPMRRGKNKKGEVRGGAATKGELNILDRSDD